MAYVLLIKAPEAPCYALQVHTPQCHRISGCVLLDSWLQSRLMSTYAIVDGCARQYCFWCFDVWLSMTSNIWGLPAGTYKLLRLTSSPLQDMGSDAVFLLYRAVWPQLFQPQLT